MNFTVVKSSAGSGKTYSLVKEYLALLLKGGGNDYFRHILAITFTNKATEEMKQRVLGALEGLESGDNNFRELKSELRDLTELDDKSIAQRCGILLKTLLHDYGDFNISTIDQFVHRLVRSFSFELNIPAQLEIELKNDRLIRKTVDGLFEQMSTDERLYQILRTYSEHKFDGGLSYDPESNLKDLTSELLSYESRTRIRSLQRLRLEDFNLTRNEVFKRIQALESRLSDMAMPLIEKINSHGMVEKDFYRSSQGVHRFLVNLAYKKKPIDRPNSYVYATSEEGKWLSPKAGTEVKASFEVLKSSFSRTLDLILEKIESELSHYVFCKALAGRIFSMAIVNEVKIEIDRIKEEFSVAQLDDFNQVIADIVNDNPTPYIYERLGERYQHYLIDEFQDTSLIQWFNLLPLVENSLSEGHDSFLVGDPKQAIYRWRGGEPDLLNRLPDLNIYGTEEKGYGSKLLTESYKEVILGQNFRSSPTIVEFVNELFDSLKKRFANELNVVYDSHRQVPVKTSKGRVEVRFFPTDNGDETAVNFTVQKILEITAQGIAPAQIAVLCRTGAQCTSVTSALLQNLIPFISEDSLKIGHALNVSFLLHWLEYLYHGKKEGDALKIVEYLLDNSMLGKLNSLDLEEIWGSYRDLDGVLIASGWAISSAQLRQDNLMDLVNHLSDTFLVNGGKDRFVIAFENAINQFNAQYGNDAMEFLEWWKENGEEFSVPFAESPESVRIMTIHKAKGLEFDFVIVPFAYGNIRPSKSYMWVETKGKDQEILPVAWLRYSEELLKTSYAESYEKEMRASLADTANLMYVSATRAKMALYVISRVLPKNGKKIKEENLWHSALELSMNESKEEGVFLTGNENFDLIKGETAADVVIAYRVRPMTAWAEKVMLKYKSESTEMGNDAFDPSAYGRLIHEVMSKVYELEDIEGIADYYCTIGELDEKEAADLRRQVHSLLDHPELVPLFKDVKGSIFNEREILSSTGEVFRPDRCVISGGKISMIDYKTGLINESHQNQILKYMQLATDLGYEEVKGHLLYFSSDKVLHVGFSS
ncbi:MAG: UvrD-helicase domain-containing protein [Vicingaceae bacterium]